MNSPTETLSQVNVQFEEKPNCVVSLQVEVPQSILQQEYEKAIRELNKEVSLPGYRKGKAPRDYMIDHFKSHIERRWQDNLAHRAFNEAMKNTSLRPMDPNSRINCDWKRCSLTDPSALALFEYEVVPKLPQVDYQDLAAAQPTPPKVDASAVDHELQELARRSSSWQAYSGGQDTDQEPFAGCWIELEVLDGESKPLYIGKRFEYSQHTMPKDLYQAVEGMKVGQKKECSLKRPGSQDEIAANVELKAILEKKEAAVDDQLAISLGLTDLAALKERIEKNQLESLQSQYKQSCFEAIQKSLSDKYSFDVPQSAMGYEIKMQENALLAESGKSEENLSEEDKRSLKEKAQEKAQAAIRQTFLLHKIASQENIHVEDHEVHEIMRPFMYELEKERDQNRLRQRFQNLYSRCRMHLIAERALEKIAKAKGWL